MADTRKRGYLLENFRLFHLRTENPTAVDYHYHDFCKMILIVSGGGSYFVDGHRYLLQSGDIILLGSNSVHRPELDASPVYERIIIYISPEFLKKSIVIRLRPCRIIQRRKQQHPQTEGKTAQTYL